MAVEASGASVNTDSAPTAAESSQHSESGHAPKVGFAALAVGSIGVVFGDIGTSPLYAFKAAMDEAIGPANQPNVVTMSSVLGVVSLALWALILVVPVKYVL